MDIANIVIKIFNFLFFLSVVCLVGILFYCGYLRDGGDTVALKEATGWLKISFIPTIVFGIIFATSGRG